MNIYQKIAAVMQDVQYLCKDDRVEFGNTKYKAISEEKVTSTVRESLIKNGIVIIPVEQAHHREGTLSTVDVSYRVQNVDDPEDFIVAKSSGTGADTQDKGVGKAMTYAYKYLLLRTFAIPTGEDPDKVSSAELDDKAKKAAEAASHANQSPKYISKVDQASLQAQIHRVGSDDKTWIDYLAAKFPGSPPRSIGTITPQQYTWSMAALEKQPTKDGAK